MASDNLTWFGVENTSRGYTVLLRTYRESIYIGIAFIVVILGFVVSIVSTKLNAAQAGQMPIAPQVLLEGRYDFEGKADAPYTLVEFGDYECPPCRSNQPVLEKVLRKYSEKLRLDFRHLPLTSIHPHAQNAAVVAEIARQNGKFWPMHHKLYGTELNSSSADVILSGYATSVDHTQGTSRAEAAIARDGKLAARLGVTGTPTFFLCTPEGTVIKIGSPADLSALLK